MEFNDGNLIKRYNHLADRVESVLSPDFVDFLERDCPLNFISQEKNRLIRSFLCAGYLIRTAEESFGNHPVICDEEIQPILNCYQNVRSEQLQKAVDTLDARSETCELSGVSPELLINSSIVESFETIIDGFAKRWYPQLKCDGIFQLRRRRDARELIFRNAVWGYLFRATETIVWTAKKDTIEG